MTQHEPNKRAQQKEQSHRRIVKVAARRFREEGLAGAGVQRIMEEAGLTHGGFYSHFESKADLMAQALSEAVSQETEQWISGLADAPEAERLVRLVSRYLTRAHRDTPGAGCPLPSVSADMARAPDSVRHIYDNELRQLVDRLNAILEGGETDSETDHSRAVGALALCVGGMLLARAVSDAEFSDDILKSCRQFAADVGPLNKGTNDDEENCRM